jgi:hypothetical protein
VFPGAVLGGVMVLQVMQGRPTGVVAACKDSALAREIQELFASPAMRVNTSSDVTGDAQGGGGRGAEGPKGGTAWHQGGRCQTSCCLQLSSSAGLNPTVSWLAAG